LVEEELKNNLLRLIMIIAFGSAEDGEVEFGPIDVL